VRLNVNELEEFSKLLSEDTTRFSGGEFQFQPPVCSGRLKLRLHAAEAGGVSSIIEWLKVRAKLKLHAAKAGGVSQLQSKS
jgi:hypothetical protein